MLTLTAEELRELTQRKHADAQRAVLDALGIHYRTLPDGKPVVLRSTVEAALGGTMRTPEPQLRL